MFTEIKARMDEIQAEIDSDKITPETAIKNVMSLSESMEDVAAKIADKYKLNIYAGDYGSGRTYYPAGTYQGWDEELNETGVWVSSSQDC